VKFESCSRLIVMFDTEHNGLQMNDGHVNFPDWEWNAMCGLARRAGQPGSRRVQASRRDTGGPLAMPRRYREGRSLAQRDRPLPGPAPSVDHPLRAERGTKILSFGHLMPSEIDGSAASKRVDEFPKDKSFGGHAAADCLPGHPSMRSNLVHPYHAH
jgi:hypothetical protein